MSKIKSIDLVVEFARKAGYLVENITIDSRDYVSLFSSKTGRGLTFDAKNFTLPADSRIARRFFTYKQHSYALANRVGIRTPKTIYIGALDEYDVDKIIKQFAVPKLIVKPNDGARGNGFTGDISSGADLGKAIENARKYINTSDTILVQEQFFADEARLLLYSGKIKGVLLSQRPRVIGDGQSTIAQLIEHQNLWRDTINETMMIPYVKLDENNVASDLLNSQRILGKDEVFYLNHSTATVNGALIYNFTDKLHRSYVDLAEKMVAGFGRGMTCVDFFINNPTEPASDDNYALVEMNEGISLPMCYRCVDGNHFDIMKEIVEPLLTQILDD
jgi:glutathione synthase/RimK-type ligase-like ATP-grasp enzyme